MLNNRPAQSLLKISAAPIVLLILHIVAIVVGWYEIWWWFDIPMHFLGGVAITISSFYLLEDFSQRKQFSVQSAPLKILTLVAFAALAAVAWELLEFTLDTYAHTNQQPSILDTIKDLAMGISGGGLVAVITAFWKK